MRDVKEKRAGAIPTGRYFAAPEVAIVLTAARRRAHPRDAAGASRRRGPPSRRRRPAPLFIHTTSRRTFEASAR